MARIGNGDTVDCIYLPMVKALMQLPHFNGILGGRNGKAFYFLGSRGADVIYLDPHFSKDASPSINYRSYLEQNKIMVDRLANMSSSVCFSFLLKYWVDA